MMMPCVHMNHWSCMYMYRLNHKQASTEVLDKSILQ